MEANLRMHLKKWVDQLKIQEDSQRIELALLGAQQQEIQHLRMDWLARIPRSTGHAQWTVADIEQYLRFPDRIARETSRLLEQESEIQRRIDRCRSNIVEIRRNVRAIERVLAKREALIRQIAARREERSMAEMIPPHEEGNVK